MLLLYGAALVVVLLAFQSLSKPSNSISYSRFRDLVKAEIGRTLKDPAQVADELNCLLAALGGGT